MAQQYKIDTLNFAANGSVKSDCADITFYNQGTSNITLNNSVVIFPGSSISFTANYNEIDRTNYFFTFNYTGTGVRIDTLIVLRKIYI